MGTKGTILLVMLAVSVLIAGAVLAQASDNGVQGIIDDDSDGLPDVWEIDYLGGTGYGPLDDPDGDDFSNAYEFEAGTDPLDAADPYIEEAFLPIEQPERKPVTEAPSGELIEIPDPPARLAPEEEPLEWEGNLIGDLLFSGFGQRIMISYMAMNVINFNTNVYRLFGSATGISGSVQGLTS